MGCNNFFVSLLACAAIWQHFIPATALDDTLSQYLLSCFKATDVASNELQYCGLVNWKSGRAFDQGRSGYSNFAPGEPLSRSEQDDVASEFGTDLLGSNSRTKECKQAIMRYACVSVFPLCPEEASSLSSFSYYPACKLQCEQANRVCQNVVADCSGLREEGNCMMFIPDDRYLLNPSLGPYGSISVIYTVFFIIWLILTFLWIYLCFIRYNTESYSYNGPLMLSKVALTVPTLRIIVLGLSIFFWRSCYSAGDMCERLFTTPLFSMHHISESAQMLLFLVIARGWGYTRTALTVETWRSLFCLIFSFYLISSIVASIDLQAPSLSWIIYTVSLYGFMFAIILHYTMVEMSLLYAQVKRFAMSMPLVATAPLNEKYYTYVTYLSIVILLISLEIVSQYMYATQSVPFWKVLLTYELCSAILFIGLGIAFRPRPISPFFYMTPTSLEGTGGSASHGTESSEVRRRFQQARSQRPTPIVEINISKSSTREINLEEGNPSERDHFAKGNSVRSNNQEEKEFDLTPLLLNSYIPSEEIPLDTAQDDAASILYALRELGISTSSDNRPMRSSQAPHEEVGSTVQGGEIEMQNLNIHPRSRAAHNSIVHRYFFNLLPDFAIRREGNEDEELALLRGNGDRVHLIALQGPDQEINLAVQRASAILPSTTPRHIGAGGGTVAGAYSVDQFSEYLRAIFRFRPIWRTRTMVVPTG